MTVNLALGERFADDVPPRISGKEDLLASQDTASAVCTSRWFARAVEISFEVNLTTPTESP